MACPKADTVESAVREAVEWRHLQAGLSNAYLPFLLLQEDESVGGLSVSCRWSFRESRCQCQEVSFLFVEQVMSHLALG